MKREETLNRAIELTTLHRDAEYGSPGGNGLMISRMWSAYLGHDIKPHDVFAMMALLKVARCRISPQKADNWLDLAGYAACGAEVSGAKDSEPVVYEE